MMSDGLTELALMFKERNQKTWSGIQTGKVINGFPDIQIRLSEHIVLFKDKLLFASHLMAGYERDITINGTTNSVTVGDHGSHSHHTVTGTINFTDTLVVGDTVITIPTSNEQKYYVIDKVEVV